MNACRPKKGDRVVWTTSRRKIASLGAPPDVLGHLQYAFSAEPLALEGSVSRVVGHVALVRGIPFGTKLDQILTVIVPIRELKVVGVKP